MKSIKEGKIAVVTSILLGIVTSLLVVNVTTREPGKLSAESALVRLQTCMKTYDSARQICLEELIINAVQDGVYQDLGVKMGKIGEQDSVFRGDCHTASHRAGPKLISIYEQREDERREIKTIGPASGQYIKVEPSVVTAFNELDTNACGSSIGHGLAEAFADSPRTLAEWQELLNGCDKLQSKNLNEELGCAHGVGHALVIAAGKNFSDASIAGASIGELVKFCDRNVVSIDQNTIKNQITQRSTEIVKHSCSFGVMMGAFAPITEKMIRLENPEILVSHCRGVENLSVRRGCFAGAGFALGRNLEQLEKSTESLSEMLLACNDEEKPFSDSDYPIVVACREQVLLHIRLNVNSYNEKFTEAIIARCSALEDRFGRKQAASCIASIKRSENETTFNEIVSKSGTLGQEAISALS